MVLDTIVEAQTKVIQALTEAGYQNVKDSLLCGITENEIYPFILVDIDSSDTVNLASGLSTPVNHNLVISVYQKSSMGVKEARLSAAQEFDNIMQILNLSLTEERVEYLDTVMNGIKLCGVTAVLEVGLGESIEYHPLLGITSDPIGAILTIDNHPTNILTPTVIRNARSGVYSALKEGYTYLPQTVDLSDRKDKSIVIPSSYGKLNAPNIYFDYGTGLLHIDTEYTQCEIRYRLDGGDPHTDYRIWKDNIYIDTSQVRAYVIKEGYEDSDITEYNIEVPFVKIVAEADNLDIISVIRIYPNVDITLTSNSENLLLSLDQTTWSNQVTALSGAYRPIYLKAVETGTYYIYKSSGTIIYLGYQSPSSTLTNLFYQPFSLDYKNIICKCYLYYKTVEGYTYFDQLRAAGLKLFIIGSIPDADCNPLKILLYPANYA